MSGERVAGAFRVTILGGGTAGWMTAAALSRLLPADAYRLTLIESDEIGTVGVGEATLPHLKLFNDMLGLDEAAFMTATGATFKLGIEFDGWQREGAAYIHPFGAYGEPWGGVQFQHHWLRMHRMGREVGPFEDYSFAVAAAKAGRFSHPNEDPASIRSTYSYAYHLDAGLYARLLRDRAIDQGVTRVEGRVTHVERDGETGDVTAIALASGERVAADFFVDCSGFRALLLDHGNVDDWEDWRHWLPCDRALAVGSEPANDPPPYTRAIARPAGWQWRIPLQHRTGNGYIFSSDEISVDEASATLLANLDGAALSEPRLIGFTPGRRQTSWRGNAVAIGLSSGFLEPLESTSIYLIQAAVIDLANLMPVAGRAVDPRLADEFNRLSAMHYERIRDFLILHYVANERHGERFWDRLRRMALPDSLAHKLALFRERGAAPDYQFGLFARDSWLSVMVGQGIMPANHDRGADAYDPDLTEARLDDFRDRIASAVSAMPSHRDFLHHYGGLGTA